MNDRVNEREAGVKRKVMGVGMTLIVVASMTVIALGLLAITADGSKCVAPQGYQLVENRMAHDLAGNTVFIGRGVISTGEGTVGGKEIVLPPCGSKDSSLKATDSLFIILDGKQVFLAAGSVGRDVLVNPTEAPQP